MQVLPKFKGARNGSGCDNPDCDASQRHIRVLSEFETDRMYPSKEELPQWPFPPQATHACDMCGYCYQGVAGQVQLNAEESETTDRTAVDIDEYDWDPDMVYEHTVREAIEALIRGRPEEADADELAEAVFQYVPGAGARDARDVIGEMSIDVTAHSADDFM